MFLDPLFIFGYGIIPAMGVMGAAIATVLAQVILFSWLLIYVCHDKHLFCYVNVKSLPDFKKCKRILRLSIPTTIQATIFPVISITISRMVAGFGDDAVAVQRLGSQIETISWNTSDGFAIAVNSFLAQNYGARNLMRAKRGFYTALAIISCVGIFATIMLVFFAENLFGIFLNEPEVLDMGVDYLTIMGYSQLFICIEILSSNSMNAFGKTTTPAIVASTFTATRIPLALVLTTTSLGLCGIWWSISISTFLKGTMLFLFMAIFLHNLTGKNEW